MRQSPLVHLVIAGMLAIGCTTPALAQVKTDGNRDAQLGRLDTQYEQAVISLDAEYARRAAEIRGQTDEAKRVLYEAKPSVFERGKDEVALNQRHQTDMSALSKDIGDRKSTLYQNRFVAMRQLHGSGTITSDTWALISPQPAANAAVAGSAGVGANDVSTGALSQTLGQQAAMQTLPSGQAARSPSDQSGEGAHDADGDGYASVAHGGADCDDRDVNRYPGNIELGDPSHDEDCDPSTVGVDRDGDGYVNMAHCNGRNCGNDCNDSDASIHPSAAEVCDGIDNNCDTNIDDVGSSIWYPDNDHDLFGASGGGTLACQNTKPAGHVDNNYDCDDNAAGINPGNDNCPRGN